MDITQWEPEPLFLQLLKTVGVPAAIIIAFMTIFLLNAWLSLLGGILRTALSAHRNVAQVTVAPHVRRILLGSTLGGLVTLFFFLQLQIWVNMFTKGKIFGTEYFPDYFAASFESGNPQTSLYLVTICVVCTVLVIVGRTRVLTKALIAILRIASAPGVLLGVPLAFYAIFAGLSTVFSPPAGTGTQFALNQFLISVYSIVVLVGAALAVHLLDSYVGPASVADDYWLRH